MGYFLGQHNPSNYFALTIKVIEFYNTNELSNFVEKFRYTACINCSTIININEKKYTKSTQKRKRKLTELIFNEDNERQKEISDEYLKRE